ncbi:hypothetical protein RZS28_00165 [Methylocapsa polymorpha]|uniref:Uncharacterized protein n=1 Tax=Methylocapsa polymorpha TaxID=3080828 RepID=A0ABZ0HR38_9HYPH|nr:hypothetical protein RZS28_00165 [Methylocapsa sp. RX1]
MATEGKIAASAIPQLPPERLETLRAELLQYLYKTGAAPDYSVPAARIEAELGLTRDEIRAVHNYILMQGLVAERARLGHIGLSTPGQIAAKGLIEPDLDD